MIPFGLDAHGAFLFDNGAGEAITKYADVRLFKEEVLMPLSKRLAAEFIGTLWLVLGGVEARYWRRRFPISGLASWGVSLPLV